MMPDATSAASMPSATLPPRFFQLLLALGVLANLTGFFPPILEPDGALYATIAKRIAQTGDWTNLYAVGQDWLDKPHFPFWMAALSMKLFGATTFAYKLPAQIFFFVGVWYTYRFARLWYSPLVAQIATLLHLTAFHTVLSNSDVRAEPYLTALIIAATYHLCRFDQEKRWFGPAYRQAVAGAAFTGAALMTKGLFVAFPIGGGLLVHWLATGRGRELLNWRWYVAILLALIATLPELWALYVQFDAHPEKVVFGKTGVSGIRFFFWDSQFGRFFNTGPIKGAGEPTFFLHTVLWAFLPWSLLFYAAILAIIRKQLRPAEWVAVGAVGATFLLFSASSFQLPHYLNIVYPFMAVLTAQYVVALSTNSAKLWLRVLTGICLLLLALALVLLVCFPSWGAVACGLVLAVAAGVVGFGFNTVRKALLGRPVVAMLAFFLVLNAYLYPRMMQYQAGLQAARWLNAQPAPSAGNSAPAIIYKQDGRAWAFEYYVNRPTTFINDVATLRRNVAPNVSVVFTPAVQVDSLRLAGLTVQPLDTLQFYRVSTIRGPFLNPVTRPKTLEPFVLARVGIE